MNTLKINELSFQYISEKIIQNFTANILGGSNVMLIGDNGSGKSTFAKLICGIIKPTKGSILINQSNPHQLNAKDKVKLGYYISQINQLQFLFGNLKQEINLIEKIAKSNFKEETYQQFYLPKDIETNPFELSINEAWRFALFGSTIMNPAVLFIDELPSAVNERNIVALNFLLEKRRKEGLITFLSYQRMVNLPFEAVFEIENSVIKNS